MRTAKRRNGFEVAANDDIFSVGNAALNAASVVLVQGTSCFRLRLSFDGPLLKTLVAAVYPLEAVNTDEALRDVASEISNIIAGYVKTFINQKGFNVSRDVPVVEDVATSTAAAAGSFSLNFSIFSNSMSVGNFLNVTLL